MNNYTNFSMFQKADAIVAYINSAGIPIKAADIEVRGRNCTSMFDQPISVKSCGGWDNMAQSSFGGDSEITTVIDFIKEYKRNNNK